MNSVRQKIAICGLARDCREALERNWRTLQKLEGENRDIFWIFVENDSVDGSREWLDDLAKRNPNVKVLGNNIGEATIPAVTPGQVNPGFSIKRISKMAFFRNIYLDYVKDEIGLENLDAVIVVDFDVYSLPVTRLKECLATLQPGVVVSALGTIYRRMFRTEFYDCYAYRELGADWPQTIPEINSQRMTAWRELRSAKVPKQVNSNFNGCAIYPPEAFRNIRYVVLPNQDPEVECYVEHVGLHAAMSAEGIRVVIDPSLRVRYETPGSYWAAWAFRQAAKIIPSLRKA